MRTAGRILKHDCSCINHSPNFHHVSGQSLDDSYSMFSPSRLIGLSVPTGWILDTCTRRTSALVPANTTSCPTRPDSGRSVVRIASPVSLCVQCDNVLQLIRLLQNFATMSFDL
ncbi:hypothetical protein A0H81_14773 [Grifola frondosa]|uniref:Uncharacterized protein n=1 Tax=Grifola frondosa TaxID=5627 RepID=A0A1C7LKS5_GRIFR|nr:hypothetical protein A0H81_14773 [Grifola frondosa]